MNNKKKKVLVAIIGLVVMSILFVSAAPGFGTPTPFQKTLNEAISKIPIDIAGKQITLTFEGAFWRGQLNGQDLLAGECNIEENDNGAILTLKQSWAYVDTGKKVPVTGKPISAWVETPGPEIVLEYKKGPPAELTKLTDDK
ncbi:MAG: hypothetical protein FWG07_04585 [Treponema sp.]|nr:hypothetical protein [Treponema sp.]